MKSKTNAVTSELPLPADSGNNAERQAYNRGYFQGFAAAHRGAAETVRGYFFYNIRLMASQGISIEEILGDLDPQRKRD